MPSIIVVGTQWGDEGKGKFVDILSDRIKAVVRAQGGHNAGHTVIIGDQEFKLHLIPSGILHEDTECFIGAGTVIDPEVLIKEIEYLKALGVSVNGRLWISTGAHVIFPYHKILDTLEEERKGKALIGTTHSGIGPCYADKVNRIGLRIIDLLDLKEFKIKLSHILDEKNELIHKIYDQKGLDLETIYRRFCRFSDFLKPFICKVDNKIRQYLSANENILLEGAQGTFLDISWGTYPFVTSSNTISSGICSGAGLSHRDLHYVLGISKAYTTRVGSGPFPSAFDKVDRFPEQQEARELGTTTGRVRRLGWFDAVLVREAVLLNGIDSLALTKLDILDKLKSIKICIRYQIDGKPYEGVPLAASEWNKLVPIYEECPGWETSTVNITSYKELPMNAQKYLNRIEELCGVPISMVSVGPKREQTVIRQNILSMQKEKVS